MIVDWKYVRDEDNRECAIGERNGVRFRVVPYHRALFPDAPGACVQRWEGGRWETVRSPPRRREWAGRARGWQSVSAALRAVEKGECDPPKEAGEKGSLE